MTTQNIEELETLIKKAAEAYYNLDPIMADAEYDELCERLKTMKPGSYELTRVGFTPDSKSSLAKVDHIIPMGSLNKVTSESELIEWASKFSNAEFYITHKMDGCSLELVYEDGHLKCAVTRGDGYTGEDVSATAFKIPSIPKTINKPSAIIRGEIIILKETFERHFAKDYANARNTATGKLRDISGNDASHLSFVAFDIITDNKFDTLEDKMDYISKQGFSTPHLKYRGNIKEVISKFVLTERNRHELLYEIDGCVIQVNGLNTFDAAGEHNLRPNGAIAYKFKAESTVSTISDVKWTVGPTGRVTPVAVIEPANIGGVTITNVSLQNVKVFKSLGLFKGARVLVARRNDVIPYIEENLDANL